MQESPVLVEAGSTLLTIHHSIYQNSEIMFKSFFLKIVETFKVKLEYIDGVSQNFQGRRVSLRLTLTIKCRVGTHLKHLKTWENLSYL